jgi:hypothetical protein
MDRFLFVFFGGVALFLNGTKRLFSLRPIDTKEFNEYVAFFVKHEFLKNYDKTLWRPPVALELYAFREFDESPDKCKSYAEAIVNRSPESN